jgi:hypothetical protein
MATTPKELVAGTLLTNSLVTLYTSPANTTAKIYEFVFCNSDTTNTIGVTLHLIESGDTAADKNKVLDENGFFLAPYETRVFSSEQRLRNGGFLQAKADTTGKVSIRVSGDEVS